MLEITSRALRNTIEEPRPQRNAPPEPGLGGPEMTIGVTGMLGQRMSAVQSVHGQGCAGRQRGIPVCFS